MITKWTRVFNILILIFWTFFIAVYNQISKYFHNLKYILYTFSSIKNIKYPFNEP